MGRRPVLSIVFLCLSYLFILAPVSSVLAQGTENPTATLKAIRAEGASHLNQSQVIALSGLSVGSAVGRQDLQSAADRLVQTGLFSNVNYVFQSKEDGLYLTFKLVEVPRILVYFDNIPWFADSEINEAIRKVLPFYDGTLPEGGATVDQVSTIVTDLIASRGMRTVVEHQLIANPLGEGSVQDFRIADVVLQISKVEFGDPKLASSKAVQQHLSEIQGKTYSRMIVDLFLAEQVKPIYLQQGFLRAKLGPPEIRLSGNPNQHLPDQIPVFVPVTPGIAYKFKGAQWSGHALLSVFTLNQLLGMKPGEIANGMAIQGALERIQETYGQQGYLDAKVESETDFDDQAQTVSYRIIIHEGRLYKFGKLVLTGISPGGEKRLRAAWPILSGDVFDKTKFEDILLKLQVHREQIFVDLPIHYESVGHWLQTDQDTGNVDVLLDFK
ncbi:MAG TPA: POTRA domain-containing protein [Candidatus Dormibacteraeota bacterium]|nr:POTRA domain-containing protein [Candidatus Dormibacteraeota bacterium]